MLLDLNQPASIVTWWAVFPERHGELLSDWARRRPEHRSAILQARRLIEADPSRRELLRSVGQKPNSTVVDVAPQRSHDEQAAGEADEQ